MTPVEALTQIRALCDEADRLGDPRRRALTSGQVRAVLDAVSVDATPAQDVMAGWRSEWGDDADYATPAQGIDRDHAAEAIRLARQRWVGGPDYEFDLALADAVLALVRPVEGAHLDPKRAAEVLDWCKREGGLDLYGWGDLISRLQECIVPSPPDAQSKVSDAYRRGFEDARTRFGASS